MHTVEGECYRAKLESMQRASGLWRPPTSRGWRGGQSKGCDESPSMQNDEYECPETRIARQQQQRPTTIRLRNQEPPRRSESDAGSGERAFLRAASGGHRTFSV